MSRDDLSRSNTTMDPRIGRVLQNRYRILERLGVGGMGQVYRGERIGLRKHVAIKFLHSMFASSADAVKRFEREAKALGRLTHPNCISVIDVGVDETPYIVMDHVEGECLEETVLDGPMEPRRAIHIIRQLLAALAHAHGQNIVHRDVKPGNIMLTDTEGTEDHVSVLDFGLAKFRGEGSISKVITQSSVIVGTPGYMSPEQASGEVADRASDLYAVGITLFELLTGEKPFVADQAWEVLRMHREDPVPRLRDRMPEGTPVSVELEAIVAGALAKNPDRRYASAESFRDALSRVPECDGSGQMIGPAPVSRGRWKYLVGAVAAAAALAVFPLLGSGSDEKAKPKAAASVVPEKVPAASAARTLPHPDPPPKGEGVAPAPEPEPEPEPEPKPEPEPEPKPEPKVEAPKPVTLASAKALIKQGKRDEAIRALIELRKQSPKSAYLPYRISTLFAEKKYYASAIEYAKIAIARKKSYKRNRIIIRTAIAAVVEGRKKARAEGSKLLRYTIGRPALPALQRVAKRGKNRTDRRYAAWLVAQIEKRHPKPKRKRVSKRRKRR